MRILRPGDSGPLVYLLQRTLLRQGYNLPVDGKFEGDTEAALLDLQRSLQIPETGLVGDATWQALLAQIAGFTDYTVLPGDTFHSIARRFGVPTWALVAANPDIPPENLPVGKVLLLPLPSGGGNPMSVVITDIPYSYDILRLNIFSLRARYPFLRSLAPGNSVLGNNLYALRFGKGPVRTFYNGSHHANEWITTPILMKFLEQLCIAYASDGSIFGQSARDIFEGHSLYFMPMVNPDGVDLVTGALSPTNPAYQAALSLNTQGLRFPDDWKANIRGVDLNLNYPAEWEKAKQVNYALGYTAPGPRNFVGDFPLSQPETQTVAAYTRRNAFDLTLSYHTQGEVIFWKFMDYDPPGAYDIATELSKASGYALSTPEESASYAGYKDWFIQEYNLPGYTIEAGKGKNPLPLSQFDAIYQQNIGVLVLGALLAGGA